MEIKSAALIGVGAVGSYFAYGLPAKLETVFWFARHGRYLMGESPEHALGNEEVYSRTARVSIVRWNLKEAVSKLLVRRTEITYKARNTDKSAKRDEVPKLLEVRVKCGG